MEIAGHRVTVHLAPPVAGLAWSSASAHAYLLEPARFRPSKVSMRRSPLQGTVRRSRRGAVAQDFRGGVRLDELGKGWKAGEDRQRCRNAVIRDLERRAVPAHCYAAPP